MLAVAVGFEGGGALGVVTAHVAAGEGGEAEFAAGDALRGGEGIGGVERHGDCDGGEGQLDHGGEVTVDGRTINGTDLAVDFQGEEIAVPLDDAEAAEHDILRRVLAGAEVDQILPGGEAEVRDLASGVQQHRLVQLVPMRNGEAHDWVHGQPPVFPVAARAVRPVRAGIFIRRHPMRLDPPLLPLMRRRMGIKADVESALVADEFKNA